MPSNLAISRTAAIGGQQYTDDQSVAADVTINPSPSIPAAKTGTLSTRTDSDTGILTMAAGHGITTGALLDVYWSGGSRVGMTVGTVATNSVPIDGGSGDSLPVVTTAVTAAVPHAEVVTFTGSNAVAIAVRAGNAAGTFHITAADGTTIFYTIRRAALTSYVWNSNDGVTNPVAGDAVGKILFSHADAFAAQTMFAGVGYN